MAAGIVLPMNWEKAAGVEADYTIVAIQNLVRIKNND